VELSQPVRGEGLENPSIAAGQFRASRHRPAAVSSVYAPSLLTDHVRRFGRYNRWAKAGVWLRIFETLAAQSPQSLQLIT